jgi:hypothetical protein
MPAGISDMPQAVAGVGRKTCLVAWTESHLIDAYAYCDVRSREHYDVVPQQWGQASDLF